MTLLHLCGLYVPIALFSIPFITALAHRHISTIYCNKTIILDVILINEWISACQQCSEIHVEGTDLKAIYVAIVSIISAHQHIANSFHNLHLFIVQYVV